MLNELKQYKLFQRLIAVPYALIFVAFLLPLASVSCMDKVVAQPNAYSLSMGVNLTKALDAQTIRTLDEIQKNGDESMKIQMLSVPKMSAATAASPPKNAKYSVWVIVFRYVR